MSRIVLCGELVKPLESIPRVGAVLGMSKATALRRAESDEWPLTGPKGRRLVVVPALAAKLQIPYEVEEAGS